MGAGVYLNPVLNLWHVSWYVCYIRIYKILIYMDNWRRESPPYSAPISSYLVNISELNQ